MSSPPKIKPDQPFTDYSGRPSSLPVAPTAPASPAKKTDSGSFPVVFAAAAFVLIVALLIGIYCIPTPTPTDLGPGQQALFTGLSHAFAAVKNLLLAAGIAGAAALLGLFFYLRGADNKTNRSLSEIQKQIKALSLSLAETSLAEPQEQSNAMPNSPGEIQLLRNELAENQRLTEAVHKIVSRPEFPSNSEQLSYIKNAVEELKIKFSGLEGKLKGASALPAPAPPAAEPPEFNPVGDAPAQRLEKALAYYMARVSAPGKPAQANLNALRQAAQDSLAMENRLETEGDALLDPADLWIWDILDRDIYAAPLLPTGWQEIPENEAKPLTQLNEELIRYRRSLVQKLAARHNVKRMETLPCLTKFDTALHQADESSKVKTTDPKLNLFIASVRAAGFMRNSEILRKPKVTYYLYTGETDAYNLSASQDIPALTPLTFPDSASPPPTPDETETQTASASSGYNTAALNSPLNSDAARAESREEAAAASESETIAPLESAPALENALPPAAPEKDTRSIDFS